MTKRNAIIVGAAGLAIVFGGAMLYRTFLGGRVSDGQIKSIFDKMPTDELIVRRATLAAMLEQTPPSEPKSKFRLKNEQGLAELDEMLRARGIDPETVKPPKAAPAGDR